VILFAAIVPTSAVLRAVESAVDGNGAEAFPLRPLDALNLPVARFGNTTYDDAHRLTGMLADAAADWSPLRLSLGGASVVETPAERTLGIEVRSEDDSLLQLSLDIKKTAERMRFLLDRRDFTPILALASVRAGTPSGIDAAAAALASFESDPWLLTAISMRKQTYGNDYASEELAQVPIGVG
jgi:2'-5' RNA ligase